MYGLKFKKIFPRNFYENFFNIIKSFFLEFLIDANARYPLFLSTDFSKNTFGTSSKNRGFWTVPWNGRYKQTRHGRVRLPDQAFFQKFLQGFLLKFLCEDFFSGQRLVQNCSGFLSNFSKRFLQKLFQVSVFSWVFQKFFMKSFRDYFGNRSQGF